MMGCSSALDRGAPAPGVALARLVTASRCQIRRAGATITPRAACARPRCRPCRCRAPCPGPPPRARRRARRSPPLDAARVRSLLDHLHRREVVPDRDRALPDDRVRERATGGVVGLAALGDLRTPRQPEAVHRAHARALDGAAPEHRAAPLEDAPEVPEHLPYSGR